jgi:hypothetical protein
LGERDLDLLIEGIFPIKGARTGEAATRFPYKITFSRLGVLLFFLPGDLLLRDLGDLLLRFGLLDFFFGDLLPLFFVSGALPFFLLFDKDLLLSRTLPFSSLGDTDLLLLVFFVTFFATFFLTSSSASEPDALLLSDGVRYLIFPLPRSFFPDFDTIFIRFLNSG